MQRAKVFRVIDGGFSGRRWGSGRGFYGRLAFFLAKKAEVSLYAFGVTMPVFFAVDYQRAKVFCVGDGGFLGRRGGSGRGF